MKYIFSILLSLVCWTATAAIAYDFDVDGIPYSILSSTEKTVEVKRLLYYSGSVVIPATVTYDGVQYSVTSICIKAFYECSGLTSITIPEGVTSIGDYAFYGCSGLTTITIPGSVTSIGRYAFGDCSGLTSITISEGVTSIGQGAFYKCSGLTSVTIPESVTRIDYSAFYGCSKLKVVFYNAINCTDEGGWFNNCKLFSFCIKGEKVKNIPKSSISGVEMVNGGSVVGDFVITNGTLAAYIGSATDVVIPEYITRIGQNAFYGCSGLTSITIPESVTRIDYSAFYGCSGLTTISIPEGVTRIPYSAFYGCSGLTSITISEGVTSIGEEAFYGCSGLTSITIPESVTSIGDYAFFGCSGLTSITIPEGVTSIGYQAFYGCSGLTTITIPESVTSISRYAFYGCSGLTTITIPEGVTSIDWWTFYGCSGLTSITIPEGVTSIGKGAFCDCSGLTSITIPESVTNIDDMAFSGCRGLTSITIPESVTRIGDGAFSGCKALKDVYYEGTQESWDAIYFVDDYYSNPLDYGATLHFVEKGLLEVEQHGNGAVITWPAVDNADKYELTVMRNGEVLETIVFDKNGLVITDGGKKADAIGKALSHELYNLASGRYTCLLKAVDEAGSALKEGFYEFEISGTPTGVKTPKATPHRTGIYDLMGHRLSAPQHGINIINGKKVLVK